MRIRVFAVSVAAAVCMAACGGSTTPSGPSDVALTPGSVTIAVSGAVRDAETGAGIGGADVQVTTGPDAARSTTTDASGNYSLTGVRVGIFTVRFAHAGFETLERPLNVLQDTRVDVQLRRGASCAAPPAPTGFRASVNSNRVTFTWTASPGATSYLVVIGTSSGSSNSLSASTIQTTFQWRGAPSGTFFARVFARSDCPHDASSNEISFTIVPS